MSQTNSFLSQNRPARGEIFYVVPQGEEVKLGEFVGGRPAIIVSNDMNNEFNGVVEVVYMTREGHHKNDLPTDVKILSTGQASIALCNQIYTVHKKRIGKYVGQCTISEMKAIDKALSVGLCMDTIFNQKNIVETLDEWKKRVRLEPDADEIENIPYVEPTEEELAKAKEAKERAKAQTVQAKESVKSNEAENSEAIIKLTTERDLYKQMYQELLAKCVKAGVDIS